MYECVESTSGETGRLGVLGLVGPLFSRSLSLSLSLCFIYSLRSLDFLFLSFFFFCIGS